MLITRYKFIFNLIKITKHDREVNDLPSILNKISIVKNLIIFLYLKILIFKNLLLFV